MLTLTKFLRTTGPLSARMLQYTAVTMLGSYMALLVYFSLRPSVPGESGISDKVLHFIVYGGLAALWAAAMPRARLISVMVGVSLVGVGLEIAQGMFGENRSASVLDQIANMAGALCMLLVWAEVRKRLLKN